MATIANTQFQCGNGDVNCFCNQSNYAYGVRDCTRQACSAADSAAAVAFAAGQCGGKCPTQLDVGTLLIPHRRAGIR